MNNKQLAITLVATQIVNTTDYNPPNRSDAKAKHISGLAKSVQTFGILNPLIGYKVPGDRIKLVDGNRRFAAAQEAGLEEVPMMLIDPSMEEAYYTDGNYQKRKHNGNDILHLYLHRPDFINPTTRKALDRALEYGATRDQMIRAYNMDLGTSFFTATIWRYVNMTPEFTTVVTKKKMKAFIDWALAMKEGRRYLNLLTKQQQSVASVTFIDFNDLYNGYVVKKKDIQLASEVSISDDKAA